METFDHASVWLSIDQGCGAAQAAVRSERDRSPLPPRGGRGLGMGGTSKLGVGVGSALPKAMRYTLLVLLDHIFEAPRHGVSGSNRVRHSGHSPSRLTSICCNSLRTSGSVHGICFRGGKRSPERQEGMGGSA